MNGTYPVYFLTLKFKYLSRILNNSYFVYEVNVFLFPSFLKHLFCRLFLLLWVGGIIISFTLNFVIILKFQSFLTTMDIIYLPVMVYDDNPHI